MKEGFWGLALVMSELLLEEAGTTRIARRSVALFQTIGPPMCERSLFGLQDLCDSSVDWDQCRWIEVWEHRYS